MEKGGGEVDNDRQPHCLLLPYPLQGHINPMIQFAKRLSHKGIAITIAVTKHFLSTAANQFPGQIPLEAISDGFDEGKEKMVLTEYLATFRRVGQESLAALLERLRDSGRPVDCVVYNPFLPWALDVAKGHGLRAAAFFTQSCGVNAVYYKVHKGEIRVPVRDGEVIRVPGLPELGVPDAPSFLSDQESHPGGLEVTVNQFDGIETADFVFVNSIYELEQEVTDWLAKLIRVKTIGPTLPSSYLDKRIPDGTDYCLSLFKPVEACSKWLNQHPARSVIYVSFGSVAQLKGEQMEELAHALEMTKRPFLWVVRSLERVTLPEGFQKESEALGFVVPWCRQLEVLSHGAVGCMVTHCGWNSTLEGLSLGVPMVAIPWWSDQGTNAKFVMDVWKVGVRAWPDDRGSGVVRRGEIVRCIEHVMGDEEVLWKNVRKLKDVVRGAIDEGGSSDRNIEEFVSVLKR